MRIINFDDGFTSATAPVSELAASAVSVTPSGNLTSTDVQAALVELQGDSDTYAAHVASVSNPHTVTKTQVGLSSVTNDAQVKRSEMGVANGVATLDSGGIVPTAQLPAAVVGAVKYQGTWDADANSPTLVTATGNKGDYYVVNTNGTTTLDSVSEWKIGDWAIFNGTAWEKIDNTDAVTSVSGRTGAVTLTSTDVGLSNVDNTSDAAKNAAAVTLTNKTLTAPVINSPTGIVKADVGLGNVDNTSDATKNAASVTLTNKTLTAPIINSPTGIVKADVGLGSVDNTSDATKNSASSILTNKTISGANNTLTVRLGSDVSGTLPVGSGGTGVTSVPTSPAASVFAAWDANVNLSAANLINGYATTATAASTTTLTVADKFQQYFTGSTTQTVKLPVTSTLVLGQRFQVVNLSSGIVTVQSSGANSIQAQAANTIATYTCILTSGTTAASWAVVYSSISAGLSNPMTTAGDLIYSSDGSGTPNRLAAGTSGQWLASAGATAPVWSDSVSRAKTFTGGVVFNGGGTNLNTYEEWSGTVTLTGGLATSPTVTAKITQIGRLVCMHWSAVTATSNATTDPQFTFSDSGSNIPTRFAPTTGQYNLGNVVVLDLGISSVGSLQVSSSGIFFYKSVGGVAAQYTASGTKGVNDNTACWQVY